MELMDFMYIDISEAAESFLPMFSFGIACGCFLSILLHLASFAIFGLFRLIYDINK